MIPDMVSVVIPCRNEVKSIAQTVRAILRSRHQNLEVLVVDGMSTDGTRTQLGDLINADPRVKVIDNPKKLTPFAFNLGIKHAQGEYIQIVGARNVLDANYISQLLTVLKTRMMVACVGGDFQHVADTKPGKIIALAMDSGFGVGTSNYRTQQRDALVDTVGIPMYRAKIFKEVGMFDESLTRNQDDDFNFRLRRKKHQIMYLHSAKATYLVRPSLEKLFDQMQQYGYFKVFVNQKHGAVTTMRQMIPPLFVAFLATALPVMLFWPFYSKIVLMVLFLYLLTGLAMAGRGLIMLERFQVLRACFIMHIGYATGYWMGIWDFIIMRKQPRASMQMMTT